MRSRCAVAVLLAGLTVAGALAGCTAPPDLDGETTIEVQSSFAEVGYGFRVQEQISGLDAPSGVAVTPEDDWLYFAGGSGHASGVGRVHDDGDTIEWLDVEIKDPGLIAADAAGALYVVDRADGTLAHSSDGGATWTRIPAEAGSFVIPEGVAARDGLIAVTNTGDDSVSLSADAGETWTSIPAEQGAFSGVAGVAIDSSGSVWVVNSDDASLAVSHDHGASWTSIPATVTGFDTPYGIAAGAHGDLYVTDPAAGSVSRSVDGGRSWFVGFGFADPWAIDVDPDGKVFIADSIDTIAQLVMAPAAPVDLAATWIDETTLEVSWALSPVSGGAPATNVRVSAEPELSEEQALLAYPGLREVAAAITGSDRAASPSPSPTGALPPTEGWEAVVEDRQQTSARIVALPRGSYPVHVVVTVSNEAGRSDLTRLEVPAR